MLGFKDSSFVAEEEFNNSLYSEVKIALTNCIMW